MKRFARDMAYLVLGIMLGGALAALAMTRMSNGSPFTDDFTRANSESVGNNWQDTGSDGWDISANTLRHDVTTTDILVNSKNAPSGWADYYWKWTIPASGVATFFLWNYQNASNFYQIGVNGAGQWIMHANVAGTFNQVWVLSGAVTTGTQYYKLSVRGYHITFYYSASATADQWRILGQIYDRDHSFASGQFGFRGNSNGWTIDDVVYREPGITVRGSALDSVLNGIGGAQDLFEVADNETVGGIWTDNGTNSWRVLSSSLHKDNTTDELLVNNVDLTDQIFGFSFKFVNANEILTPVVRYVTSPSTAYYQVVIRQNGTLELYKFSGTFTQIRSTTTTAFSTDTQYEALIWVVGSRVRFFAAQYGARPWTQFFDWIDTDNVTTHGVQGFRDSGVVYIDNIQITPPGPAQAWTTEYLPSGIKANVVTNSGFESCVTENNDPPKWQNNSAANTGCTNVVADTGGWSAYVQTATTSMLSQGIYVTPGYTYTLSIRARRDSGSGASGYGTVSTAVSDGGSNRCTTGSVSTTSFATVTCNFTATYSTIYYVNLRNSTTAKVYFDNVTISSSAPTEGANSYSPAIVQFNGQWRRYFGRQGADANDRIWMQTSTDTVTWSTATMVLDVGTSGAWDDRHVNDPSVVVSGSTLYLYYTGCRNACVAPTDSDRVGLATTTDGSTFTKYGSNPVISVGGSGAWNEQLIGRPSVLIDGTTWKMWVDGHCVCAGQEPSSVGYYTSTDGQSWTAYGSNPVYGSGSIIGAAVAVQKFASTYYMFTQQVQRGVWYATSSDGIAWTDQSMIQPPTWETTTSFGMFTPEFFKIGSSQRLYVGQTFDYDDGGGYDGTFNMQSMALAQFYKRVTALSGSRRVAGRTWVVNDSDVKVELDAVGSLTVDLHATMDDQSAVISTITTTVVWGDVFAGSVFPVPALWWEQQRERISPMERWQ